MFTVYAEHVPYWDEISHLRKETTNREGGKPFLYSRFDWPFEVIALISDRSVFREMRWDRVKLMLSSKLTQPGLSARGARSQRDRVR